MYCFYPPYLVHAASTTAAITINRIVHIIHEATKISPPQKYPLHSTYSHDNDLEEASCAQTVTSDIHNMVWEQINKVLFVRGSKMKLATQLFCKDTVYETF